MAKGGARPGAGNPGYGKLLFLRTKVEELSPLWFQEIEKMMKSKKSADKRFALAELNKLQVKMIPQELTGEGGGEIKVNIMQYGNSPTVQVPAKTLPVTTT